MSVIACPYCHAPMTVSPELAGSGVVRCPRCGNLLSVAPPALPASPDPAPAEEEQAPAPRPPRRAKRARAEAEREEPSEDKSAPRAGSWATFGCCLLVILSCGGAFLGWSLVKQRALDDLAAGDRLYAENKKGEAAAKYKSAYSFAPDDRRAQLVGRIADYEAGAGNAAEARRWITTGLDAKLNVNFESAEAKSLHAQVQRERAEAEAKKKAEKEAKEKADQEAEENRRRYGDAGEATTAAQTFVKRQLAFPAEARFSILGRDTKQNADRSWRVSGEVTGKNAFGVKVKFRFQVTVLRQANGDWQEIEPVSLAETG